MSVAEREIPARRRWMAVLAQAKEAELDSAFASLPEPPAYALLRAPEVGLAMLRARAGNTGGRFNLGEMTMTRCSVALSGGAVGHAYLAGRKPRAAELAAVFDALLQDPARREALERTLIAPVAARLEAAAAAVAARTAATRVEFFTMVRGD